MGICKSGICCAVLILYDGNSRIKISKFRSCDGIEPSWPAPASSKSLGPSETPRLDTEEIIVCVTFHSPWPMLHDAGSVLGKWMGLMQLFNVGANLSSGVCWPEQMRFLFRCLMRLLVAEGQDTRKSTSFIAKVKNEMISSHLGTSITEADCICAAVWTPSMSLWGNWDQLQSKSLKMNRASSPDNTHFHNWTIPLPNWTKTLELTLPLV